MKILRRTFYFALFLMISGCAIIQPRFENPSVSLTSFQLIPSENMAPRFEIGLHVINPNKIPLPLQGMSYTVMLEGHQLLKGVTTDLPSIPAYGEGEVVLQATADLFSGLRLLNDLMSRPRETFTYELKAKLDIGSLLPIIWIREAGEITLQQLKPR